MDVKNARWFNIFLMLMLILFWGSSFVFVDIALGEGLTPIAIATIRFLIAGSLFLVAILLEKMRDRSFRLLAEKKDFPTLLLLALTGVTFFFTIQYTGIDLAGPSIAAIIVCLLSPILIAVFSALIFKERLTTRQVVGILFAGLGTSMVIAGGSTSVKSGSTAFWGTLILLATPVLWATYTLLGKRIMAKYNPFLVVAYVNLFGGWFLVPFSLAEGSLKQVLMLSTSGWSIILFLAVTCSFIGYYVWFYVISQIGLVITSSFLFAEPLVTALFALALVGEKLSVISIIGGLLIFAGVSLVVKK
jgi:drug/metabolite transporter (DMT)-like permease